MVRRICRGRFPAPACILLTGFILAILVVLLLGREGSPVVARMTQRWIPEAWWNSAERDPVWDMTLIGVGILALAMIPHLPRAGGSPGTAGPPVPRAYPPAACPTMPKRIWTSSATCRKSGSFFSPKSVRRIEKEARSASRSPLAF